MAKYILKRLIMMIFVLLGVIIVVFSINYISPGDPVNQLVGTDATPEMKDAIRAELGLDKPFLVQLTKYTIGVVTKLDLGTSYKTKVNVLDSILDRFPVTLTLAVLAVALASIIAIPLGIISALKHNTTVDYIASFISLLGASVQSFLLGLMLMILFSVNLDWLPASGVDSWKGWIMPVFCATIYPIATIMRTTRASMLEVIRQDYIRTARSKGIAENKVIMRHALKNAIIPVVTLIGLMLGMILGGIIVLEAVFSIPGLGMLLRNAIATKDTPIIVGTVLFASFMMCAVNLIVDIFYAFIDPRIKAQYTSGKKHTAKKIAL